MVFTFLVTVFWNVELGLEYGILASVIILLIQISKLDMDSIGQLSYADEHEGLVSEEERELSLCALIDQGRKTFADLYIHMIMMISIYIYIKNSWIRRLAHISVPLKIIHQPVNIMPSR